MRTDIVIVGSGPSGLSLGYHLERKQRDFIILEKGAAAQSWADISPDLALLTPWWVSAPVRGDIFAKPLLTRIRAAEYHQALNGHAQGLQRRLLTGHRVDAVRRGENGFEVAGPFGAIQCNKVVACSGYYATPHVPALPTDGSIPTIHAGDYTGLREVASHGKRRILVVGKRITAGQAIEQLHFAGHDLAVSARGAKVTFQRLRKPNPLIETTWVLGEYALLGILPKRAIDSYPAMGGGEPRRLIESGLVTVHDLPAAIENGCVRFVDGTTAPFDLVVFATGYRPTLGYLDGLVERDGKSGLPATEKFQCVQQPGIYLLGFDQLIDLRSRYFRGIRKDARQLAGILDRS